MDTFSTITMAVFADYIMTWISDSKIGAHKAMTVCNANIKE